MDHQQPASISELALACHKQGYNCAESVLRAFRDRYGLALDGDALRIASGFGGGLGQAGCMCGALAGAVMVLGLLQGRTSPDQSRDPIYGSARELHGLFAGRFGATCCRAVNRHPFGSSEQKKGCYRVIGETADLLAGYLAAKGLIPAGEQSPQ